MRCVVSLYHLVIDVCVSTQGVLSYSCGYIQLEEGVLARVRNLGLLSSVGQRRNHPCRIHLRTRKTAQLTRAGVEWESWI